MSAISNDDQQLTEKKVFRKEMKYSCNECDFETTRRSSLYTDHQAIVEYGEWDALAQKLQN